MSVVRFMVNDRSLQADTLNGLYTAVGWNLGGVRTAEKTHAILRTPACYVAAWDDGELVGFGRLLADAYTAQVLDVMTRPEYRERGVASGVLSRLLEGARDRYLGVMLVAANGTEGFYARFGFRAADPATDKLMYSEKS